MNTLKLSINEKPYPYKFENYDSNIKWGVIKLSIVFSQTFIEKTLINIEWNVNEFLTWLIQNKTRILNEDLGFDIHKSIASQLNDFNNNDDFDEDKLEFIYNFRSSHGIRFGLRGTDIDEIYIGKNGNKHEISYFGDKESWVYEIDLISFFEQLNYKTFC